MSKKKATKDKDLELNVDKFFDLSLDMFCIAGVDGYFKKVNPAFSKTLGWSEKELLSKPFMDFVHEQDIKATKNALKGISVGNPAIMFENRYLTNKGKYRWISWNSSASKSGFIYAVARDITKLKENEEALNRFKIAVENAHDHVVITDSDGIVNYANKAVERITGYSIKETLGAKAGKLWGGIMPKSFYKSLWDTIKNKGEIFSGQLQNKKKNGVIYTAEVKIIPVLSSNKVPNYFVGIERDVTEAMEIESMNDLMVDREIKMIDLKKEIDRLNSLVKNNQTNQN